MNVHTAYIGIGSNIGDKVLNCKNGITGLTNTEKIVVKERSAFYKTEPVDYKDQDWFINVVALIETTLEPIQLLKKLRSIERNAGRMDDPIRFGPRILDLDIILYDDLVMNSSGLTVPHPRMHKRRFVLRPICDIDPTIVHPVFKINMQKLLDRLDENEQRIFEYKCAC